MITASRSKKGYYVKRLKEALWSTFGASKIWPFKDTYSKTQMLEWKTSEEAKMVHKELYDLVDPDDPRSDTLLTVIIKTVFLIKSLQTKTRDGHNRVLETIFDTNHLSPKIDADIIES